MVWKRKTVKNERILDGVADGRIFLGLLNLECSGKKVIVEIKKNCAIFLFGRPEKRK